MKQYIVDAFIEKPFAGNLGKQEIDAYQASKRGGFLHCELYGNGRIAISGKAVVAVSEILARL